MWYRKCMDTSQPPFEIPKEETTKHPLLEKLLEDKKYGLISEEEMYVKLIQLVEKNPEVADSLSKPMKDTISGILSKKIQPQDFFSEIIKKGLSWMNPKDIDYAQHKLEEAGLTIDAKDREMIPPLRKLANDLDFEWYDGNFENEKELSVDESFKRFISRKIPFISYELNKIIGKKIDKDMLEEDILSRFYTDDEQVMYDLLAIFMNIYLRNKD